MNEDEKHENLIDKAENDIEKNIKYLRRYLRILYEYGYNAGLKDCVERIEKAKSKRDAERIEKVKP